MDVQIRCVCPNAPHEQDTVTLPDTLTFRETMTVRQAIRQADSIGRQTDEGLSLEETTAVMVEAYLIHCIRSWSLVDEAGEPLPPTRANIRTFIEANVDEAEDIGDVADELYTKKVVLPLLNRPSTSSGGTRTVESTSPKNGHSPKSRKPSKPSSTTTTPMVVTGPMPASPGSGSSYSPS